jgi:dynein heavy chain
LTRTQRKADMATRLVNGLADENVRWTEAVKNFDQQEAQFVGDVLVAAAFVSYIGAFNARCLHPPTLHPTPYTLHPTP